MYKQIWKRQASLHVIGLSNAIFFPKKLVERIHLLPVPATGVFFFNCEGVKYGFFGNLEVISKTAFSILLANVDVCDKDTMKDWKIGEEHGKCGA